MVPGCAVFECSELLFGSDGDYDASLSLSKQDGGGGMVQREVRPVQQHESALAGQDAALREAHRKSAVRYVMAGGKQPFRDKLQNHGVKPLFRLKINSRRPSGLNSVYQAQVFAAAEPAVWVVVGREKHERVSLAALAESGLAAAVNVVQNAEHADRRRWKNRSGGRFVVKGDVARYHWCSESFGCGRNALDTSAELPEAGWLLRVGEIEVVGDGDRARSDADYVSRGLGYGDLAAGKQIEEYP